MATYTVTVAANNEDITAKFYAAYASCANNGDDIDIECGNFTPPFYIIDTGLWTRAITKGVRIRTLKNGTPWYGDLLPNPYGDGLTYKRRVVQRPVIWRGFVDHNLPTGRTKEIRGVEFQYDNATYWPDWMGAGETWVTKGVHSPGYPGFMVRLTDAHDGTLIIEECDAFGGYGPTRQVWDMTLKYPDFDSPTSYFSKDSGTGPTDPDRGVFRRAGTAGWTTPGPAPGWGDTGTLRNERPDGRLYNTIANGPGFIGGGIPPGSLIVRDCYIHDVSHGIWSGGNRDFIIDRNEIDRIYGFGSTRNTTASQPGRISSFSCNVLGDSLGHPNDLGNPHSDWTACFGNGNYSTFGVRVVQNIVKSRKNARATCTLAREQPTTGAAYNEGYLRGPIYAYNVCPGIGQSIDCVNALDAVIYNNVSLVPLWDAKAAGAITSDAFINSSTRGIKRSVGIIKGNFTETLLNDTLAFTSANIIAARKDAVKQGATFVDATTEPTTLNAVFNNYRGKAGIEFVPAAWTLQNFLETIDLSGLPAHLAFVPGRSTGTSQLVSSNFASITKGGTFTPGAGLSVAVYDTDETTVLVPFQTGALDLTPYVGKFARVRATSSSSAGVSITLNYTFAGNAFTWRLSNPTLNRIPGVNISGYRARRQGLVDALGQALTTSKQLSFMFVGKRDTGGATQQKLAMLMPDTGGNSDPTYNGFGLDFNSTLMQGRTSRFANHSSLDWTWNNNFGGNDFQYNQLYYVLLALDFTKDATNGRRVYVSQDGNSWQDLTVGFSNTWPGSTTNDAAVLFNQYFNAFWDDGTYQNPFDGDVYMAGLWNKFIDWSQPSVRALVNINNPDEIGPRFEMLDADREPALWAFVGSKALIDSTCNLNPNNPLTVLQAGVTTDLAIPNSCLPGERLVINALQLQTPNPRVGLPVDVLVTFSGPNAETLLTPTWGGVARSAQDGAKTAAPVSNGVIFSATPTAVGDLTLSIANNRNHTNPASLTIPIAPAANSTTLTGQITIPSVPMNDQTPFNFELTING